MKNSTAEQYNNRNVIRQMVEIRELAQNSTNDVAEAVQKGDAAMVKATEALAKAEAVNQLATDANTNANAALVKADDAKATAQAVDGKAQTALDNSDMAVTDAGDALTTAQEALVQVEGKQDKGDYALRSELPDIAPLATKEELNAKQDKLTAGNNITIIDNVISATGGSGPSGDYLPLTGGTLTGPLEVPDINLVSDVNTQKVMPAKQVFQYINETDDAIARIDRELDGKQPVGEYATLAQLGETNNLLADVQNTANAADGKADANALIIAEKQDKLTAGANITIEGNVISATGGGGEPVDAYNKQQSDARYAVTKGHFRMTNEYVQSTQKLDRNSSIVQDIPNVGKTDHIVLNSIGLAYNDDSDREVWRLYEDGLDIPRILDWSAKRSLAVNAYDVDKRLEPFALKTDLPDLEPYATRIEVLNGLDKKQNKGDYALKSEVPSIEGLATETSVTALADRVTALENIPNASGVEF